MPEQRFPDIWTSAYFWIVVFGTAIFKAASSPGTISARVFSLLSAVFFGAVLSESVLEYLKLTESGVRWFVVTLLVLTGEHLALLVMAIVKNPKLGFDLWREFKGGKNAS